MLKVGDFIKCRDEKDCKETLFELSLAGFGGVVANVDYTYIRVTSVPDDSKSTLGELNDKSPREVSNEPKT